MPPEVTRRLPIGAEVQAGNRTHFRVWAPPRQTASVVIESGAGQREVTLAREPGSYFSGMIDDTGPGTLYRYRLDGGKTLFPDPVSRFQPDGPHGPSRVVDPGRFQWSDWGWRGCEVDGQVIYELHIGTFTRQGTYASAIEKLSELADLGITIIELMPVADFPGRFGWGYDGVNMFAPTRLSGDPDDLRRFVDRAHALRLGVILDVVYNHIGPDGNYLKEFAPAYFTDRYKNEWGQALNFDGSDSGPAREFFLANAAYWIDEFHFDGFRLDATQNVYDSSADHVLTAVGRRVREAARGRGTIVVAENEAQTSRLVRPVDAGGNGLDMLWNDDYHHSAMVVLSGHNEAYYTDFSGSPQEFVSAAKWGYLFQGQRFKWQKNRRGAPAIGLEPRCFVNFLQNHDQIANSARGQALPCPGVARPLPGTDRLDDPDAGNADALPGRRVRGVATVSLFCRS